jgi:hypothetical protein
VAFSFHFVFWHTFFQQLARKTIEAKERNISVEIICILLLSTGTREMLTYSCRYVVG